MSRLGLEGLASILAGWKIGPSLTPGAFVGGEIGARMG